MNIQVDYIIHSKIKKLDPKEKVQSAQVDYIIWRMLSMGGRVNTNEHRNTTSLVNINDHKLTPMTVFGVPQ